MSGGLAFTGAPTNFGAGEGLIAMVDRLREDGASTTGLVHGSGGMAAKHAHGLLSASPPAEPFVTSRQTPELHPRDLAAPDRNGPAEPFVTSRQTPELHPRDLAAPDRNGPAVIDGVTGDYIQEPPTAVALVRFEDGARAWATALDQPTIEAVTTSETVGTAAEVLAGRLLLS